MDRFCDNHTLFDANNNMSFLESGTNDDRYNFHYMENSRQEQDLGGRHIETSSANMNYGPYIDLQNTAGLNYPQDFINDYFLGTRVSVDSSGEGGGVGYEVKLYDFYGTDQQVGLPDEVILTRHFNGGVIILVIILTR